MEENNNLDFTEISADQKTILLDWAKKVKFIQKNKDLSFRQKLKKLNKLNNADTFKSISKLVVLHSKRYWKSASWAEKLGIIGASGTLIVFGSGGAGIAALGGAIGLPLFLVTAAGGTLIGTIIDKLEK